MTKKVSKTKASKGESTDEQSDKTEVIQLRHTDNHSVQPVALMRLGLFVPSQKAAKAKKPTKSVIDATDELVQLSVAKAEGYSNVTITGSRLDMDSDFKTWVGLVRGIQSHGDKDGNVNMSITGLAKLCGYPGTETRSRLRKRITDSLSRLMTVVIHLQMKNGVEDDRDGLMLHLITNVQYSDKNNTLSFSAHPKLKELYHIDHNVLLHLKVIKMLPRRESAQAIYTFIESLPKNPAPVSMARLRTRLNLKAKNISEQNRIVRRGIDALKEIGYLECTETKRGRSVYFIIHKRNPKLKINVEDEGSTLYQEGSDKQKQLIDMVSNMDESKIDALLKALSSLGKS